MPGTFISAIFWFVVGVIALVVVRNRNKQVLKQSKHARVLSSFPNVVMVGSFALSAIFMVFACLTQVSTKNIGVVTSFGRPVNSVSNGLHPKLPWQKVTELDAAIQTDSHVGEGQCTSIRIGNESTACVDNSIRWRIQQPRADSLFRDYRGFDNIRDSLVTRELNAALNTVLGDYNPLDAVKDDASKGGADLDDLATQVTDRLQGRIGQDIDVLNVIIPLVRFDAPTQEKINQYQSEIGNTRIAEQSKLTAAAKALANQALSASVSNDPNVLVSRCFDTLNAMVDKAQPVPAGFTCWPGSQSAIVVPSAAGK